MTPAPRNAVPGMPEHDRTRLEYQVLVLQSTIAGFFVLGAITGLFGEFGNSRQAAAAWIGGYHIVHAWYILRFRIAGRPNHIIETLTPLCDVSCITMAWVVLGDAQSPFWAVYLYALVGYGRRYHGQRYVVLASFIAVNLILGHMFITVNNGDSPTLNSDLITMVVLAAAMAALSQAVGEGWRRAEMRARILSETDPLTGIANRRVFHERLDEFAREPEAAFSLLMLDLDDFKRLNDQHGHLHGDAVLTRVAKLLEASLRERDFVARYGGEEFIVFMPDTALDEAARVAERLRKVIYEATPTTVSVGGAEREPGEPAESVLRRADDLLLTAKRNGKNAVRTAEWKRTA